MKTKMLGAALALSLVAGTFAGVPLAADAAPATAVETKAQAVLPDTFTVRFVDGNRVVKDVTVHEGYADFYSQISIPRIIVNGELGEWKADCIDLTVMPGDYLSGQTLDLDYTWTDKNPVITFRTIVEPESFNVRFVAGDKVFGETTVSAQGWGAYDAIHIPKVPRMLIEGADGEYVLPSQWKAVGVDLTAKPGDFISGQTLDLDFTWTETNPTIVFEAAE